MDLGGISISMLFGFADVLKAQVGCNTSSGQYFTVETSENSQIPWLFRASNTKTLLANWSICGDILEELSESIATTTLSFAIFQYIEGNNAWIDNYDPPLNSIAAGNWFLNSEMDNRSFGLAFEPNGTLSVAWDLAGVHVELSEIPAFSFFQSSVGFIFPLLHWLYLADFGQTSSTVYPNLTFFRAAGPNAPESSEFYPAVQLPSTYNIFVNETGYDNMISFVFAWFESFTGDLPANIPTFHQTSELPLEPNETSFVVSYSCNERQLKSPVSLVITVIAADYALIVGGYSIVKWIGMFLEKRRENGSDLMFSK
jgi:hypothetical protein